MEEIRLMWYEILDELLQCPVCLDTKEGVKSQCMNGHHVCITCQKQLVECPICKSYFINTRNLAVEQISAKLMEIKTSLLQPHHAINRRVLKDKICMGTQTEITTFTSSACQTEPNVRKQNYNKKPEQKPAILPPKIGKGTYPCRIGSCTIELPHGRIIGHIRYHHKDAFHEFTSKGTIFTQKWTVNYSINQDHDFVFHIKEMGIFFLNISIHQKGDLTASVQIINSIPVSKQFTYTLEAGSGPHHVGYTGGVKSCRVRKESLVDDCLYVRENSMRNILENKTSFHCNLCIKRKINNRTIVDGENQSDEAISH